MGNTTHDLYRQYGRQIYAYCYHRLRSKEEAEDAVQTTFMNAFRSLQRGASTEFEQAWLFKIAQNVCIARSTSTTRRLRLESPNDFETLQETVAGRAGEGTFELIGIEDALEDMPENQRRAILLREWQGLSYKEIGEELQLSQPAVEMLIFRARRSLAGALERPERGRARAGRKVGSLGSILGALKTLLGGGAAIKAAAVAAAAVAVVGESASHTIVREPHATGAAAPAIAIALPNATATTAAAAAAAAAQRATPAHHVAAVRPARASTPSTTEPRSPGKALHLRPTSVVHAVAAVPQAEIAPAAAPAPASPPAPVSPVAAPPAPPADEHKGEKDDKQKDDRAKAREPAAALPPVTVTTTTAAPAAPGTVTPTDTQPRGKDGEHAHDGNAKDQGNGPPQQAAAVPVPAPPAEHGHNGKDKGAADTPATPTDSTPVMTTPTPMSPQPEHGHEDGNGNRDKQKSP